MQPQAHRSTDPFAAPAQAWLLGYVGAVATLLANGLPVMLGALAVDKHLSASQLGAFGSAAFFGQLIALVSAFFWIHRVDWRLVSQICALGSLAACALMAWSSEPTWLDVSSLGFGALMGGCYAMVLSYWGAAKNAARAVSIGVLMQVLVASAYLYVVPAILTRRWGSCGAALLLAAFVLPIFPLSTHIPSTIPKSWIGGHSPRGSLGEPRALAGLCTMALYYVGVFAVWAFLDRIGAASGLDPAQIGIALGVSMLIGALALVATSIAGERIGIIYPLVMSLILYALFFLLVRRPQTVALFTLALVVFNFAWNVALPYQIAAIARVDATGRLLVLLPAFQAAGATAGPALAGRIAGERDFDAIYALLAVCAAIAFTGFVALAVTRQAPKTA